MRFLMGMNELVEKYFGQIEIEDTDYVPIDDVASDVAYVLLNIPIAMLKEYLQLKGQNKELPDGAEFWKETGLCKRLRNCGKYHGQGQEPLYNMLDFLEGEVGAGYQKLGSSSDRIRLDITEIPEFDEE